MNNHREEWGKGPRVKMDHEQFAKGIFELATTAEPSDGLPRKCSPSLNFFVLWKGIF